MVTALLSITPVDDRRYTVTDGTRTAVGTVDEMCPHRWVSYDADGRMTGMHPSARAALRSVLDTATPAAAADSLAATI